MTQIPDLMSPILLRHLAALDSLNQDLAAHRAKLEAINREILQTLALIESLKPTENTHHV